MKTETNWNILRVSKKIALLALLGILYAPHHSSTTLAQENGLQVIKRWDFGSSDDVKGSGWPDRWTRRTGIEYPKYLEIKIAKAANSEEERREIDRWRRLYAQMKLGWERKALPWNITPERTPPELDELLEATILNPFLEIRMDGGKAEISSPFLTIEPDSVYGISCSILAECESRDFEATAVLRICDSQKSIIYEQITTAVDHSKGWVAVSADTQYPYNQDVSYAQVALIVTPKSPDAFRGRFCFDSVNVTRAPRLSLNVDKSSRIYRVGETVSVDCNAIGMATLQNQVELVLSNQDCVTIARSVRQLERESTSLPSSPVLVATNASDRDSNKPYSSGRTTWTLPELEPGYYEIHTQLQRSTKRNSSLKQQIVVLPRDSSYIINSQLGWATKDDTRPHEALDTDLLVEVLREAGIGKLKIPIWINSREPNQLDKLITRIDRIQNAGVTSVGVIASPPTGLKSLFALARGEGTGGFLEDWTVAQALLEPIVRETSIRLTQYQLGWDDEPDFVVNPRIKSAVESLKRLLGRYSQEAQLVATNNPVNKRPSSDIIDRWQMATQIPFTADELRRTLQLNAGTTSQQNVMPWFHVTPLPPKGYSLATRIQDLAERILVLTDPQIQAKTIGWVFDPSSSEAEVYGAVTGPGIMFSPFRILARATAGMQHIGSFPTAVLGKNYILSSGEDCRIIAWSHESLPAELYFGKDAVAYDVWGRNVPIENLGTKRHKLQKISVGELPIIIDRVELKAIRWLMGADVITEKIDVVVGRTETVEVKFDNPIPSQANGSVKLICDAFEKEDDAVAFQVPELANQTISIPVRVRPEANVGMTPIQAVFQMDDIPIVISDQIMIGNDDFDFIIQYKFTDDNQLIVEIEAINKTDVPTNFDCVLRIAGAGRRAERRQILDLTTKAKRTIVLPNADQLIGKVIRLQCEPEGINRIINKQIRIEKPTNASAHQ
ncbi:MAG: hypothetical protein MUC83_05680 [Pirellula sp.]|nr:hypothetical protein [Pirellula sp.]